MQKAMGLKRWIGVLTVLMLGLPSAWAQPAKSENIVYVIGTSQIRSGDMSTARQEAIEDGLIMAVSRVLTELLPFENIVGNFQVLNESILSRTDQFVQDYKVLAESPLGNTYRLMAQTTVSVDRLKGALKSAGIHLGKLSYPRVLVCVAEKYIGDDAPSYWWSGQALFGDRVATDILTKALLEGGFKVVQPNPGPGPTGLPTKLSVTQAQALAKQNGAEVVVVGMALGEEAANTMAGSVRSYRGTLVARALRASDGQVLAEIRETAQSAAGDAQAGSREGIENAAALAGPALSAQVARAWFQKGAGAASITLSLLGIGGHIADFVKFRSALSTMSGVDSLQLKEMMSDTAALAVQYQGNARSLADAVLLLNFDTFGINIEEVGADEIRLRLIPR